MSPNWRKRLIKNQVVDCLAHPSPRVNEQRLARAVMGKRVLITGASYGIGEAVARLLSYAGARVILVARTGERLAALAEEIRRDGGVARYYGADLTDEADIDRLLARVREDEGDIDILVNNAGKSMRRSFSLSRYRDYERTMALNYLGPVRLLLGLLPAMRTRGAGQVINVSTVGVGFPPAARWGAYQASKQAFDTLFRSVELEARRDGVLFSSVYLPLVYTRMSAPTPQLREGMAPGLTPMEAARLLARAIVERRRALAPWWFYPTEVAALLTRKPVRAALAHWYRFTDDSHSARWGRGEWRPGNPDHRPDA